MHTTAGAAAFTRTETTAGATANSSAVAVTKRFADAIGKRIAEGRSIDVGDLQVRRTEERGIHGELGRRILKF